MHHAISRKSPNRKPKLVQIPAELTAFDVAALTSALGFIVLSI
jgi:hypothetical protein